MIKVHVHDCRKNRGIDYNKFHEMKEWCRDTFGKNTLGHPQVWRSGKDWYYGNDNDEWSSAYVYPVFFFSTEQQATWFRMKWL